MSSKIALFVVVATAIVAIAGFLLVTFLLQSLGGEPASDVGVPTLSSREGWVTEQRLVGDQVVNVVYDPQKQVALAGAATQQPEPPAPELTPTPTPLPVETATPITGEGQAGTTPSGGTPSSGVSGTPTSGGSGTATSGGSSSYPSAGGAPEVVLVPYLVGSADTLFSVSQYHIYRGQITSVALMARYGIDATDLVAGSTINVPVANPPYCNGLQPYVVLEGDNAFRIAQRAGIPVQTLAQINNLDASYTVYVTDVICLP